MSEKRAKNAGNSRTEAKSLTGNSAGSGPDCALNLLLADNIVVMLTEKAIPLLLMIFIGLAAYASVSLSLKNLQQEYPVREGNQKMLAEREYLQLAAATTSGRFKLMEEVSVQNSRAAHDRCHLNNVLLKLLER